VLPSRLEGVRFGAVETQSDVIACSARDAIKAPNIGSLGGGVKPGYLATSASVMAKFSKIYSNCDR